nr:hypothetical protein [uncultured Pseudoxanthomonas sp.]
MAFSISAIIKRDSCDLSLPALSLLLTKFMGYGHISVREGDGSAFNPPHVLFVTNETDAGDPSSWFARIFLEHGDSVREFSREAVNLAGADRTDARELAHSSTRVRVLFGTDPGDLHINTMVDLMVFLESIPDSAIFDHVQRTFFKPSGA